MAEARMITTGRDVLGSTLDSFGKTLGIINTLRDMQYRKDQYGEAKETNKLNRELTLKNFAMQEAQVKEEQDRYATEQAAKKQALDLEAKKYEFTQDTLRLKKYESALDTFVKEGDEVRIREVIPTINALLQKIEPGSPQINADKVWTGTKDFLNDKKALRIYQEEFGIDSPEARDQAILLRDKYSDRTEFLKNISTETQVQNKIDASLEKAAIIQDNKNLAFKDRIDAQLAADLKTIAARGENTEEAIRLKAELKGTKEKPKIMKERTTDMLGNSTDQLYRVYEDEDGVTVKELIPVALKKAATIEATPLSKGVASHTKDVIKPKVMTKEEAYSKLRKDNPAKTLSDEQLKPLYEEYLNSLKQK